jgi:carboxypeptidase family protein
MNRSLKFKAFAYISSILGLLALSCSLAFGQAISGNLTGTVLDPSGAAVNGAAVQAVNVATGQTATTHTRAQGDYLFSNLPVGAYNITVTAQGFKTTTLSSVPVELNKVGTANVKLEIGSSSTTVEVSGITPPVDTSTAQIQTNYNNLYAEDLGITSAGGTGAGVLNLSLLSPGVTQSSALGLGTGPSVGGQRPRDNNFTVEGVDNNNKSVTGALISVPNDATESFTLLSNQFNSEFGHSSGGQFNTTIKSGTNGFHGSVYEYFRNRNLNALDNFYVIQQLTENPRFDSNRYGGTIGGPILKNKLFFFTDFERQPVGLTGTSGSAVSAPTTAGLAAINSDPNVSATNVGILTKYLPPPSTGNGCIPYSNPNFIAPANGTCAAGNVEVGQIPVAAPAWENFENFVQSVDFNASAKDQLRGRYVFNKLDEIDTQANLPAFYLVQPFRWYLFTVGEYHTFTPAVLNEFRIGFNRYSNTTPTGNFAYPGLDAFPNIFLKDLGGVNIGPDPNAPQFTIQNLYQAVDNVTWTKGAHSLKFGGEWREYISPQSFTQRQRGDYEYTLLQQYLEDFSPDIIGERSSGSVTYYGNQSALYWYANDNWKATSHLALNLGIRYEYTTIPTGENLNALNSISNTPSIIVGGVNQPLVFQKPQAPKNNWAPRIGIAYSPGTSGDTSIRAGFGLAYDVLYDNIGILAVPPQVGKTSDVDLSNPTPGFFAGGALPGGGTGITTLNETDARAGTSNWIPPQTKWPYSINWNLGVQHSFGKNYTAEIRYVGTRGIHLDVQSRIDRRALVSPQNFLPTYLQQPSQAFLDALPLTLTDLQAPGSLIPAFANAGFASSMTADLPLGWSVYHGLQTQLIRSFSNGLQFQAAYTFSRTIDNSTADFFSTSLTPRRAQDFQNMDAEKSVSPLSRTHRFTLAAVYNLPFFKSDNWFMKNIVGNWGFSPIYTYESPEWADVQSAVDANLNGDSAGDRTIINPGGVPGTGSAVTALCQVNFDCNAANAGPVVAYVAQNPTAQYIAAGLGALATGGRNTLATNPTNDFDLAVFKNINITERVQFRFGAQFANLFNHPQLIPGSNPGQGLGVNDVGSFNTTSGSYLNYLTPGDPNFNNPKSVFASNARTIGLVAKIVF